MNHSVLTTHLTKNMCKLLEWNKNISRQNIVLTFIVEYDLFQENPGKVGRGKL